MCNLSFGGSVYRGKRIKNRKVDERSRSIKTQKFSQSIFQRKVRDLMSKNNEEALIGLLLNLQGKSYKMSTCFKGGENQRQDSIHGKTPVL